MTTELAVEWLGTLPYPEALELQMKCVEARRSGAGPDRLLLVEHPPVITLGRNARPENLRATRAELAARGIAVHDVARGGDVTYHGPGQLVGYPIVDLEARGEADVHQYLRRLESALVEALFALGVTGETRSPYTGVFAAARVGERAGAAPRKIASIGVGLRGWVTYHGFALNVDLDLTGFDPIVPCGLHHVEMTSVAAELGSEASAGLAEQAREAVAQAFAREWR
jgi:lipoate-protein ligase B